MVITLRQMQYVISVAKLGSFSKAADECAADQSTVSQQIKTFEDRMNVEIFDRTSIPITVTPAGKEIVEQCEKIIVQVDEMIAPFKKNGCSDSYHNPTIKLLLSKSTISRQIPLAILPILSRLPTKRNPNFSCIPMLA